MTPSSRSNQSSEKLSKPIIYSNRAPDEHLTGGAVRVILGVEPKHWIAPGAAQDPSEWSGPESEPKEVQYHGDKTMSVHEFAYPSDLHEGHYKNFSNSFLWPLLHEIPPTRAGSGHDAKEEPIDAEWLKAAWKDYKDMISVGNHAVEKLREKGEFGQEPVWVHDYQCIGVKGDAFSFHTPFPPASFLEKVAVRTLTEDGSERNVPLLETTEFQELMHTLAGYKLISFQRAEGMKNFLETLAKMDKDFQRNNQIYEIAPGGHAEIALKDAMFIKVFGHKFRVMRVMNVPVGITREDVQAAADSFGKDVDNILAENAQGRNIDYAKELFAAVGEESRNIVKNQDNKVSLSMRDAFGGALDEGHQIFVALSRNDYTKNTYEKLAAAEKFLETYKGQHPGQEEACKTHFVFFLEPTRRGVDGNERYAKKVFKKARELHEKYGDNILLVPTGGNYAAIMNLLQHKNVIGLNAASGKDGFELTGSEAVLVNARANGHPLAVIVTDGIGSCDVLKGTKEHPGAFVLKSNINSTEQTDGQFVEDLAKTYAKIVDLHENNSEELKARFDVMDHALEAYTSKTYTDAVLKELTAAKKVLDQPGQRQIG